jgi:hypothetical protein
MNKTELTNRLVSARSYGPIVVHGSGSEKTVGSPASRTAKYPVLIVMLDAFAACCDGSDRWQTANRLVGLDHPN